MMKLSHILGGVAAAAAGVLSHMSPAHALTYNWSFDGLANTSGTFDETGGEITSFDGLVGGSSITGIIPRTDFYNDNSYPIDGSGVQFIMLLLLELIYSGYYSGQFTATLVPWEIPGGATIPVFGSLLALGAMRKARKSIALKTRIANPVTTTVS